MGLQEAVAQAFGPGSRLSRLVHEFRPRPGQTEMALAIARTLQDGGVLVVEAGTGVGKTFAYLVPALLSGERVLLSTATKTLQDQLFGRNLPASAHGIAQGAQQLLVPAPHGNGPPGSRVARPCGVENACSHRKMVAGDPHG